MQRWRGPELESLDYDQFESVVNRSGMSRFKNRDGQEKNHVVYTRWGLTMLTGVVTALVAVALLYCTAVLSSWKQRLLSFAIERELSTHLVFGASFWAILAFNLALIVVATSLTCFMEPASGGSGISEVKTILNGMKVPRMLRLRTLFCKVVGTICAVAGGLPVGKEGPMVHSGAIIGARISQAKPHWGSRTPYFMAFRNDREKRDFVSCGAAAGIAAAFGAPIGGVLFVLEEGASFWNQSLTWRTLFSAMAATFTLAFFVSGMSENLSWGTLGSHTGTFTLGPFTSSTYQLWEVPVFIMMGIGGGLQGAFFNALNMRLTMLRSRWIRTRRAAWTEAVIVSLLVSTLTFVTPFILGQCRALPQIREDLTHLMQPGAPRNKVFSFQMETLHRNGSACICESCNNIGLDGGDCFQAEDTIEYPYKKELIQFYCKRGEYNDLATLMLSTGEEAIKHLFHAPTDSFAVRNLVVFWVMMLLLACLTSGIKVPSGLLVPSLLVGAAYGRLWTRVVNYFGVRGAMNAVDPRSYGLVGSVAMLGGVARMTISLTVMILECTGNIEYGLPLILTSFFARWVGNSFTEGLYHIHIHLRHIPFLDWSPPARGFFLRAGQVMTPNPKCLRVVERAGVVFDLLVNTQHNAFPVIEENPTFGQRFFAGVILRKQLNVILGHRDLSVDRPTPFTRQPGPQQRKSKETPARTEEDELSRPEARLLRSDDERTPRRRNSNEYCESFLDMEASYPRYPTPLSPSQFNARPPATNNRHDEYTLSEEDRELWVDLSPYINQTPYVIFEDAPFTRAYRLFRSAGLRHLVVVNRQNNVRGIITRRELQEDHCTRIARIAKRGSQVAPPSNHAKAP
ncbi:TPA: hypothetical protein N0F65_009190 [Lagenidium giganteum]|uniref:Chloride channel protein n=1 Tax=Lagenidium giganteum TaxID=4803 RepID=A0AAV2YRE9_9STRA|nr:TPA: hypothetical protein N0F65_009190 [Lagenidium giganteum]